MDENKAESLHVINENKKIIGIITQNELVAILNQKFIKEDAIKEINCWI